jgi:hypothetical protein
MGEQAMIPNADSERCGDPPQDGSNGHSLPRKVEERDDCQNVINDHYDGRKPVDIFSALC